MKKEAVHDGMLVHKYYMERIYQRGAPDFSQLSIKQMLDIYNMSSFKIYVLNYRLSELKEAIYSYWQRQLTRVVLHRYVTGGTPAYLVVTYRFVFIKFTSCLEIPNSFDMKKLDELTDELLNGIKRTKK